MTSQCLIKNLLAAYATNEVDQNEKKQVEQHTANCAQCRKELQHIQGMLDLYQETIVQDAPLPTTEAWEQFESELMQQFRETTTAQQILANLRKERQRIGFSPIGFAAYLQGLAKGVGVSLAPVLAWLGISDISKPDATSSDAFAALAREIGLSLRETLIQLRLGFAEQHIGMPLMGYVARHRSSGTQPDSLDALETMLREVESEYDLETSREIRAIEAKIRATYEADENATA